MKKALLFGSIGSIADTSHLQREAYNLALQEAGLDWQWDEETYRQLLGFLGGKERLRLLSSATGGTLTDGQIHHIHSRKTEIAGELVRSGSSPLRRGVAELIEEALSNEITVGWVTGTSRQNIDAIVDAAGEDLPTERFAVITTRENARRAKPAPDLYEYALQQIDVHAGRALAVEDTAISVASAKAAYITTIATPGQLTYDQNYTEADLVIPQLADHAGELHRSVLELLRS